MSFPHHTEVHKSHEKLGSLQELDHHRGAIPWAEIDAWWKSSPKDFKQKLGLVLTGKKNGEIDLAHRDAQALFFYLYAVDRKGRLADVFEGLYKERFLDKPSDAVIEAVAPDAQKVVNQIKTLRAKSAPAELTELRLHIGRIKTLCARCGLTYPDVFKTLETVLAELETEELKLEEPQEAYDEAKNKSESAEAKRQRAHGEIVALGAMKVAPDRKVLDAAQKRLEEAEKELAAANSEAAGAKTLYVTAWQKRMKVAAKLASSDIVKIDAQLSTIVDTIKNKKKVGEGILPKPQTPMTFLYLLIRKEHACTGKQASELEQAAAGDFSKFAIRFTAPSIDGLGKRPKGLDGLTHDLVKALQPLKPNEMWKDRAKRFLTKFPAFEHFQLDATPHDFEHHFEKVPVPILIEHIGILRHAATEARRDLLKGIMRPDLNALEDFIKHFENYAAARLAAEILEKGEDNAYSHASLLVNKQVWMPVDHMEHDLTTVERELRKYHMPGKKEDRKPEKLTLGQVVETAGHVGGAVAGVMHLVESAAGFLRGKKKQEKPEKKDKKGAKDGDQPNAEEHEPPVKPPGPAAPPTKPKPPAEHPEEPSH